MESLALADRCSAAAQRPLGSKLAGARSHKLGGKPFSPLSLLSGALGESSLGCGQADGDYGGPIFPDLTKDLVPERPNQLWVADRLHCPGAIHMRSSRIARDWPPTTWSAP